MNLPQFRAKWRAAGLNPRSKMQRPRAPARGRLALLLARDWDNNG
jgi:hypothetical protein